MRLNDYSSAASCVALVVLSISLSISPCFAENRERVEYSIKTIAAAMAAAQAQLTDVSYEYECHFPIVGNDATSKKEMHVVGRFAAKYSEGWRFQDIKYAYRVEGKDEGGGKDKIVAFNGTSTIVLDRTPTKRYAANAVIRPGLHEDEFDSLKPEGYIYGFGVKSPYHQMIIEPESRVEVEDQKVDVNGLSAVKLSGVVLKGSGTIQLWVCPDRSFLPIRMKLTRSSDQKMIADWELDDLVQVADGMWYPSRIAFSGASFKLSELSVAELHLAAFDVEMPTNTHVTDHVNGTSYITVAATTAPTTRAAIPTTPASIGRAISQYAESISLSASAPVGVREDVSGANTDIAVVGSRGTATFDCAANSVFLFATVLGKKVTYERCVELMPVERANSLAEVKAALGGGAIVRLDEPFPPAGA